MDGDGAADPLQEILGLLATAPTPDFWRGGRARILFTMYCPLPVLCRL